jgi:hypothetical protein
VAREKVAREKVAREKVAREKVAGRTRARYCGRMEAAP